MLILRGLRYQKTGYKIDIVKNKKSIDKRFFV